MTAPTLYLWFPGLPRRQFGIRWLIGYESDDRDIGVRGSATLTQHPLREGPSSSPQGPVNHG